MEPYRSFFPHARLLLPETERIAARVLLLPTGQSVDEKVIATIGGILRAANETALDIRRILVSRKAEEGLS